TTDDTVTADAFTSLREALFSANTTTGDDEITFDPAVFTSGSLHAITLAGAEPLAITDTSGKTTITGPGSGVRAINGAAVGRSFDVAASTNAKISGMTIRDGVAQGGAVRNLGTLTLDHVLITNNKLIGSTPVFDPTATIGAPGTDVEGGAI